MTFKVDRTPAVNQQMRDLAQRAKSRRIHEAYRDALKRVVRHLQDDPLEWGDPESKTQHPGGFYYHGIEWPLFIRYAVYEDEQSVIIYAITPLPSSPLAGP